LASGKQRTVSLDTSRWSDFIKFSGIRTLWISNHSKTEHATVNFLHPLFLLASAARGTIGGGAGSFRCGRFVRLLTEFLLLLLQLTFGCLLSS